MDTSSLIWSFRRRPRDSVAADEPDAGHPADADRVGDGRRHPRAGRRRQTRPGPAGRARSDRRGRGLIRRRSQVPDLRRRPCRRSIVWATEGRNATSLQAFFDGLTPEQKASITAVSIDMSAGYEKAIRSPAGVPHAQVVFDPFHVVQLGGRAVDQVRRDEYNRHGRSSSSEGKATACSRIPPTRPPSSCSGSPRYGRPTSACSARSCSTASCAASTGTRSMKRSSASMRGSRGRPDRG